MRLSEITKNPANPRIIKDEKFARLKKSLQEFPQMMTLRPIVIDDQGVVLGGNMRLEALKSLGHKEIPDEWVKKASELTEDQKREFIIKDNSAFGEYNWDVLANEWSDLPLSDWGVDLPQDWLSGNKVEEDESAVAEMVDRAAELQEKWNVQRGQVWEIGRHRLMCGDSTSKDDLLLAKDWLPLARETSDTVVFSSGVTRQWLYPEPDWVICWFYGGGQLRSPWGFNCWQPFLCYGKDPSLASGQGCRPDAVDCNTPANSADIDHPCPKPVQLWVWLIERLSFHKADIIYDPFLGGGTGFVAAEQTGRTCYGMEIEPKYCAVTLERLSALGLTPKLVENETETK